MLEDALRGRAGQPKVWEGRPYFRWGPLRWCAAGLMLEEDCSVLTFDRLSGLLCVLDHLSIPPLGPGVAPPAGRDAWASSLRPALLLYEQHAPERHLEGLPSDWRSAWWVELGSLVPGRVDGLLAQVLPMTY